MQKTVLIGNTTLENANPIPSSKHICQSCLKYQTKFSDLNLLLGQKEEEIRNLVNSSENQVIKQIKNQLIDIQQKYTALKKKLKQIEKQNEELFAQNNILEKKISFYRAKMKQYEINEQYNSFKQISLKSVANDKPVQKHQSNQTKQIQIQLFISKQKVISLQILIKDLSQQIVKLKELLKKRNKLQVERHKIIEKFI